MLVRLDLALFLWLFRGYLFLRLLLAKLRFLSNCWLTLVFSGVMDYLRWLFWSLSRCFLWAFFWGFFRSFFRSLQFWCFRLGFFLGFLRFSFNVLLLLSLYDITGFLNRLWHLLFNVHFFCFIHFNWSFLGHYYLQLFLISSCVLHWKRQGLHQWIQDPVRMLLNLLHDIDNIC